MFTLRIFPWQFYSHKKIIHQTLSTYKEQDIMHILYMLTNWNFIYVNKLTIFDKISSIMNWQNMVVLNLKDKRNKMNPAFVPDEMEVSCGFSCVSSCLFTYIESIKWLKTGTVFCERGSRFTCGVQSLTDIFIGSIFSGSWKIIIFVGTFFMVEE